MKYHDLRDFLTLLEQQGELKRITLPVDPHLEITEIADRTLRAGGPALLFENISGWWEVAQICVSALLGIFAIAASLNGHLYKKVHWVLRIVLAVGGLGMMIPGTLTDVAGLVLVAAVIAYQKISAKKHGGPVVTA